MRGDQRGKWERHVARLQQNVDPLHSAINEGQFLGFLLKGGKRLTATQRIGALLLGFLPLAAGLMVIYSVAHQPDSYGNPLVSLIANGACFLVGVGLARVGFRICVNALRRRER